MFSKTISFIENNVEKCAVKQHRQDPNTQKTTCFTKEINEGIYNYSDPLPTDTGESLSTYSRIAAVHYNVAQTFLRSDDYQKAKNHFRTALVNNNNNRNNAVHVVVCESNCTMYRIMTLNNLGYCCYRLGEISDAMQYYSEALAYLDRYKSAGCNSHHRAKLMNCVGVVYLHNSPPSLSVKALDFFLSSLSFYNTVPDQYHQERSTVLFNIGRLHFLRSEYETALMALGEALVIRQQHLGNESLYTIAITCYIGQVQQQLGMDKTLIFRRDLFTLLLPRFMSSNPELNDVFTDIIELHNNVNGPSLDVANQFYNGALQEIQKSLGHSHVELVYQLKSIGWLYSEMGDNALAIKYFQVCLLFGRIIMSPSHEFILTAVGQLANAQFLVGNYDAALIEFKRLRALQVKTYGKMSIHVASTLSNIALVFTFQKDFYSSISFYKSALETYYFCLGPSGGKQYNREIAAIWNNVAFIYNSMGMREKAVFGYNQSIKLNRNLLGDDHPEVTTAYMIMGHLHVQSGMLEEAVVCFKTSLKSEKGLLETCNLLRTMGNIQLIRGNLSEMMKYFETMARILHDCCIGEKENDVESLTVVDTHSLFHNNLNRICPPCAPMA